MHRSQPFGYLSLALVAFVGCSGDDGATGPQGPAGEAGADGAKGADGTTGPEGPAGVDGTAGAAGEDGRSAYLTGPGLTISVESAAIAADGTVTTTFKVTDAGGLPLDTAGKFTEGAVSTSFILAYLSENGPGDPLTYTAYTTRSQTSPTTHETATQAGTDSGGTLEVLDVDTGLYRYTFGTKATDVPAALTHTVALYATRTFEGVRYVANETFNFRPDGAAVVTTRDIITNEACNGCHGDLSAHGGARKAVALCITCHSPQTTDPDTGNTVNLSTMIHKIHMGETLPSVVGGTPYEIVGFQNAVHDYSEVPFPQETSRCETCHQGAQGDVWKTRASLDNCTGCHDRTSFTDPPPAGYTLHGGGAQPADATCTTCHPATGGLAPVVKAHLTATRDPAKKVEVELISVTNAGPGQTPVVRFKVMVGGAPRDIIANPLTSIRVTAAGPNTDYDGYVQSTVQGTGASGTLTAVTDGSDGVFQYSSPTITIPENAMGSATIGIEAYLQPTGEARVAAVSPVMAFAITGTVTPRREVVSAEKCNSCHYDLSEHGGGRKNVAYCLMCHNPDNPNDERAPHLEGEDVYVNSTDLKRMIHKLHAGEHLSQPYVLGGFPAPTAANPGGTPVSFAHLAYPRALNDCQACHLAGTYDLPLAAGLIPSIEEVRTCNEDPGADADDYCQAPNWVVARTISILPETAACTSCHDTPYAMAHAMSNTETVDGTPVEACATCHGAGKVLDVEIVHAVAGE